MTLGEKIFNLRTNQEWSQEQLAEKINVSRQAVSKWESDQSLPDVDKIVSLAQLFNVSTDYLLKKQTDESENHTLNYLGENVAQQFLTARRKAAPKIATGVMLCILSPILLLGTIGFNKLGIFHLSEDSAAGIGVICLLAMIAFAVSWFIMAKQQIEYHEEFEKEECHLNLQLRKKIQNDQQKFRKTYTKMMTAGVVLCILSAIPVICGALFTGVMTGKQIDSLMLLLVCGTLALIATGVYCIVHANIIKDSYDILLQNGDYTPAKKAGKQKMDRFSTIYWLSATLIYFVYSFLTHSLENSWLIWVVAGISYGILEAIFSTRNGKIEPQ
ncbi:hypothetical protein GCM10022297_10020 [Lactobacillus hamsteri]|uniref:HTH cro/C1-type domain-containing protein n=1 Tax=Lactobacillus hamsteri DSM 5661 = JCM 6256 TaxID=1423754 RepID=A0A0R1YEX4_9LACO|nr:helix-turn-helix transcriptional regulator [Lactobacillus hamsteri]KRM41040.1 hypothetical protein FC39_GL001684 [Lactobacillus hamsteri DSM 5661 = JCM 6256]